MRAAVVLRRLACVAAVLLPLALLWDGGANFYYDWHNHQWFTGYFGEFQRQHFTVPEVLNTPGAVGMPQPIFYGFLLFPGLGWISAVTGAAIALRIAALAALTAQFATVYAAARRVEQGRWFAFTVAAALAWSIYALTNLYNRAALTEFFAVAFLTSAVASALSAIASAPGWRRAWHVWLAGSFGILTVGAHPPTALVAAPLLAVLLAFGWGRIFARNAIDRPALASLGAILVLGALGVAPWLYANGVLGESLGILRKYRRGFGFSPERVDSLLARFSPVPYDPESIKRGLEVSTPYLEAPILFALVVLLAALGVSLARTRGAAGGTEAAAPMTGDARWRGASALLVAGLAWTALTLVLSLSRTVDDAFRFLAPYVQFSTRFVSHANLGLFLSVIAAAALLARRRREGETRVFSVAICGVALGFALVALAIKLNHGAAVKEKGGEARFAWRGERSGLVTEGRADAAEDYAAPTLLAALPADAGAMVDVRFPTGTAGGKFGVVEPVRVSVSSRANAAETRWHATNLVVFPWSRLLRDGREIPRSDLAVKAGRVCVRLPAGEHELRFTWEPPAIWRRLRALSHGAVMLVGLATLGAGALVWRRNANGGGNR